MGFYKWSLSVGYYKNKSLWPGVCKGVVTLSGYVVIDMDKIRFNIKMLKRKRGVDDGVSNECVH